MRIGCALSLRTRVEDAVDEAGALLAARLGSAPDVVFAFASPRLRGDLAGIPGRISARFSSPLVCGCSGDGVLADGVERLPDVAHFQVHDLLRHLELVENRETGSLPENRLE